MVCFAPGFLSQATHNTVKPKQDAFFKKLDFEEIGVNQRSS